jgi:ATP-dependent DNA helicase RecG
MLDLDQRDVKYLPGVGPARAALLKSELRITTLQDLLYYFPYKYIDRSRIFQVREVDGTMPYIQLKGKILSFEQIGEGRRQRLVAHFSDGTGVADLVWFSGIKFILDRYRPGVDYVVFGKPTIFGGRVNIAHPEIDLEANLNLSEMGMQPYYNTTEKMKKAGLNSAAIRKLVTNLMALIVEPLSETLPDWLRDKEHLMGLTDALKVVHNPRTPLELRLAQLRIKFEELFYVQLNLARFASDRQRRFKGYVFAKIGDSFNRFYNEKLPFSLTGAQKRVIREIRTDMGSGRQMNRLLQGDVGSGKTMVALMTMLIAIDNGYQACIMAPTEILSEQHFANISRYIDGLGLRVELLTGSIKGKRREAILKGLKEGSVNILVSTHAVLEDPVEFSRLGFVVIDEQHRFGVEQRAKLWRKNTTPPHVLVMTATPIPRTLAMTVYGDLDVSVIDELPPGRKPVLTLMRYEKHREQVYRFVGDELRQGRQAYIVYPLIEENEKLDLQALEQGVEVIRETFPHYRVAWVHGRMKPAEKEHQMELFVNHEAHILVATTVIEVGVNVPNASVMVIENAERFGLSQLHQLRGRVGRGADKSYCILMTKLQLSRDTRHRLEVMTQTTDGFVVAEEDMKLRGPGDMEGTMQSGIAFDLKLSNLARDGQIVSLARDDAERLLHADPQLQAAQHRALSQRVEALYGHKIDWSAIS